MVGNVRLERGGSFLSGGRLTIDLGTGPGGDGRRPAGVNQGGGGLPGASPSQHELAA